jgi:hypothetical protein
MLHADKIKPAAAGIAQRNSVLGLYFDCRVMVLPRLFNLSIPGMEGLGQFFFS